MFICLHKCKACKYARIFLSKSKYLIIKEGNTKKDSMRIMLCRKETINKKRLKVQYTL